MKSLFDGGGVGNDAVQNEIINLTNVVSTALPMLEALNASFFESITAQDALSQVQVDTLNANLLSCFAAQGVLSQAQIDALNANLLSCFAVQDALSQAQATLLNESLLALFAAQDVLSQKQADLLNENLNSYFRIQDTLSQDLFNQANGHLTEKFNQLNEKNELEFSQLKEVFGLLLIALQEKTVEALSFSNKILLRIEEILGIHSENFGNYMAEFAKYYSLFKQHKECFKDYRVHVEERDAYDKSDIYAEEANELAKEGNKLSKSGNNLAKVANAIAAAGNLISAITSENLITGTVALGIATVTLLEADLSLAYADGGFPSTGQMFIAREAGPELVGTIGSRSAVVNNEQIVESVSRGVYDAVRAALGGGTAHGGTTEVKLYLDGKQITAAVEKVQRERGLSLSNRSLVMA